jgi:hypothetical protein
MVFLKTPWTILLDKCREYDITAESVMHGWCKDLQNLARSAAPGKLDDNHALFRVSNHDTPQSLQERLVNYSKSLAAMRNGIYGSRCSMH